MLLCLKPSANFCSFHSVFFLSSIIYFFSFENYFKLISLGLHVKTSRGATYWVAFECAYEVLWCHQLSFEAFSVRAYLWQNQFSIFLFAVGVCIAAKSRTKMRRALGDIECEIPKEEEDYLWFFSFLLKIREAIWLCTQKMSVQLFRDNAKLFVPGLWLPGCHHSLPGGSWASHLTLLFFGFFPFKTGILVIHS